MVAEAAAEDAHMIDVKPERHRDRQAVFPIAIRFISNRDSTTARRGGKV
jgi:hypothetical protein